MLDVRRIIEDLYLAFSLLTRFPLPKSEIKTDASLTTAFWAYPVAGGAVGCVGAFVFWLAFSLSLGALPALVLAFCAMSLATGGFHEDGLADFWDGIGGGQTKDSKLDIMRDSRLGTYGALALILFFLLKLFLLNEIFMRLNATFVICIFICVSILARAALVLPLLLLAPARSEGMAVVAAHPDLRTVGFGVVFFIIISLLLLGFWLTLTLLIGALAGGIFVVYLAERYLSGYTGDVLGATAMTVEITALIAVVMGTAP